MPCEGSKSACLDCIWEPGEHQNLKVRKCLWARSMCSKQVRGDPSSWLAHQTPQNRTMTTSGRLKCGNLLKCREQVQWETRIQQVSHRNWYGIWHRHRIESFSKITIILAQGEWSSARDIGPIFKRCNARQQQTFFNMVNVYVFDSGSICIHGKNYSENFHSIKNTRNNLTMRQMFDISEK